MTTHSKEDMKAVMDLFSKACSSFGLAVSLKKTKVMSAPSPSQYYSEPDVFVNGHKLEVVDTFILAVSFQEMAHLMLK